MVVVAEHAGADAGVAGGEVAGDVGDRRPLEEQLGVGGRLVFQADRLRPGADAEVERLQAGILRPALVELAGVLDARAAEVEQQPIVPVAVGRAVDADAGAAEDVPSFRSRAWVASTLVAEAPSAGPSRRKSVVVGPGRGLEVGGGVELELAAQRGGELAVGAGEGGPAAREASPWAGWSRSGARRRAG